jgi:hypothetical protein
VGLAYPSRIATTPTLNNWNFDNVMEYILFRKISDNVFQATVMIPFAAKYWWDQGPYVSFKIYTQKNSDAAFEMGGTYFANSVTGDVGDNIIGELLNDNDMNIFTQYPLTTVRITVNLSNHSMTVNNYTLP